MANAITLDQLNDAIVAQISAQFPQFKTVEFYREDETQTVPTPALVLEMTEAAPDPDMVSDGETFLPWRLRFEGRVILPRKTATVKQDTRRLALQLSAWLHYRKFAGVTGNAATVIDAVPDAFSVNREHFEVWAIEWYQTVLLEDRPDTTFPDIYGDALYSFAPDIGIPHEPDYKRFDGEPR